MLTAMYATASLAARIERAECTMVSELAAAAASRRGPSEIISMPIGGGVASFTGPGSPANKLAGLGFAEAPSVEQLAAVEAAFAAKSSPLQVEFASLGDPAVPRMLSGRGYELIGFENVLGLPLGADHLEAPDLGALTVEQVRAEDTLKWAEVVATGFLNPDAYDGPPSHETINREAMDDLFGDTLRVKSFERFLARRGGEIAGGSSLRLDGGIAQLAGAATLPAHRRQGVQTALLRFRLHEAARRGCDIAVVTTSPGSKSTENVQRFGFAILYVRAILVKPPPPEA
jgi:GNAT superfamily N-acetyltransferase